MIEIRNFYFVLMAVTLCAGSTLWALYHFSHIEAGYFPFFGLLFFLVFSILIYHLGRSTATSPDKNKFTSVIMGMILLKLALTIGIVIIYDRLISPIFIQQVIGFLISYLFYTIFEVYFMSILARWHS
ncbi:MAG: hypothetical protein IPG82_15770 [Saprospiraceae bacterium]|jgi:hypothetical protein|nr:hypothetical protein [Saprospiraceae bacterium]MBK6816870.1 hypothetical protein [Saprospiraceae bacterium]MBK9680223.1 hypothetical protein [Saprospiraceae bacterium]